MNELIKYRLEHQYDQIDLLIHSLPKASFRKRSDPDKWSIHENLAHLGRYQEVFMERFNRILNEEQPTFERYKAENDALFGNWVAKSSITAIQESKATRKRIAGQLLGLDENDLLRRGIHPKLGSMDIMGWTEFFLLHESHHFYTIFWLVHQLQDS